ncbi:helix-turn-helix domain-containing protein [Streptomyces lydicus]|uniref:helix-turn-helix domain-containing protein n=1 Tax=Streptomyces lydicus TaxID=47763 RepID=UPI00378D9CE7
MAARFRRSTLVSAGSGTAAPPNGSEEGPSSATEQLTVQEAARLTGVSESYWRRLARRGDVIASRSGDRGQWILDGGQVAAWTADRRADLKAS